MLCVHSVCTRMFLHACLCVHVCAFQSQTSKENAVTGASGKGSPTIPVLRKKPEGRQGPGTCPDIVGYPQDWERGRGYF